MLISGQIVQKKNTYAKLIANFLGMLERLIDWIVRCRWIESLELWIIFLLLLDRLQLQSTATAGANLLLL